MIPLIGKPIYEPEPWSYTGDLTRREKVMDGNCTPPKMVRRVGWMLCMKCQRPHFSDDVGKCRVCFECGGAGGRAYNPPGQKHGPVGYIAFIKDVLEDEPALTTQELWSLASEHFGERLETTYVGFCNLVCRARHALGIKPPPRNSGGFGRHYPDIIAP